MLNPEQNGCAFTALIDAHLAAEQQPELQPDPELPPRPGAEPAGPDPEAVDRALLALCTPHALDLLWEWFGVCVEVVQEAGPCLQAVQCIVDGYTPLLEQGLGRFALDLARLDWQVSLI